MPGAGALGRIVRWWENAASWVMLPALVALVAVDVVLRYFLNLPLRWGTDVKELLLLLVMVSGLPGVTLADEHIRVSLFDGWLSPGALALSRRVRHAVAGAVMAAIAWALADLAIDMQRYGDTAEMIAIPFAPFAAVGALATLVSALAEAALAIAPGLADG